MFQGYSTFIYTLCKIFSFVYFFSGIRILGNVYLPLNTTSDLPAGSCLTVSVQEMILCGKDVNCHIPVIVNETFRNISLIKNGIPYELMAPKMKPGRYVVSAVVNVGWCRVNSVKTKMLIHTGDYHSTDLYDIDVDADTKTIGQDIYVEPVLEKETGIPLYILYLILPYACMDFV